MMNRIKNVAAMALILLSAGFANAAGERDERWWAVAGADGIQRINLRCGSNFLDPSHIVVKANVAVEISVSTEQDVTAHRFGLMVPGRDGVTFDADIGPVPVPFRFTPSLTGRYRAVCRDTRAGGLPDEPPKQGFVTVVP